MHVYIEQKDVVAQKQVSKEIMDKNNFKTNLIDKDLHVVYNLEAREVLEEVIGIFKKMMQKMITRLHVGSVGNQVILNITIGAEAKIKGSKITMHLQVEV